MDMDSATGFATGFVEEIDLREITFLQVVGRGAYGLVRKGRWRDKDVAIKLMETEQEKNAFIIEVRQLSRVNHPNIVTLYGACTKSPVCLVMEYAEGGSLYNVLHGMPNVDYTAAQAISWTLQCARGVAYLHNMKPKALIHRDLKPPNLLLIMGGTVLKVCDFGTACDIQTHMTNLKGSAAWMAPEVFEGCNYSEKCDVFSWGIILWQVLSRRKPFDEIGGSAFRIMWAVHSGQRPPLIQNCPKPLEQLMTRCWAKDPSQRPSMTEVEHQMEQVAQFLSGEDKPITYRTPKNVPTQLPTHRTEDDSYSEPYGETSVLVSEATPVPPPPSNPVLQKPQLSHGSCPPSLEASRENLTKLDDTPQPSPGKRPSLDVDVFKTKPTFVPGHRRTGSCGPSWPTGGNTGIRSHPVVTDRPPLTIQIDTQDYVFPPQAVQNSPASGIERTGQEESPGFFHPNAYLLLEPRLQPLPPAPTCKESIEIFELHRRMAQEFLHVQAEIDILVQRKKELEKEAPTDHQRTAVLDIDEYQHLKSEKDNLQKLYKNLKCQIELIKTGEQKQQKVEVTNAPKSAGNNNSDDWVLV